MSAQCVSWADRDVDIAAFRPRRARRPTRQQAHRLFGLEVIDKQILARDRHVSIHFMIVKVELFLYKDVFALSPFRRSVHHVQAHYLCSPCPRCSCSRCRLLQGSWRCVFYRLIQINDVFPLVHKSASDKDIRHAYKKLSKKYHPDKNKDPGAEERFVEIAHGQYSCRSNWPAF